MMILQTLEWKPMHGYALVQHIQQRSQDLLQVEEGSLYPALQRMLKEEPGESGMEDFCDQPARAHVSHYPGGREAFAARSVEV